MSLPEEYRDLVESYLESLEDTCAELEFSLRRLEWGGSDAQEALRALRAIAHKLAGNGASFGFPVITEAAKAVTLAARAWGERPQAGPGALIERGDALVATCRKARAEFTPSR